MRFISHGVLIFSIALFVCGFLPGTASATQIYSSSLVITGDDIVEATSTGREVRELNEKMRSTAQAAEVVEKNSHAYNTLKQEFEDLKRQRDQIGENLRGLNNREIIFYGDQANADAYDFKRRFIQRWEQDPALRQAFAGGPLHVSYDKNGRQRVALTPPRPEEVDSYVAEVDTSSQGATGTTTDIGSHNSVILNQPDYDHPSLDDCTTALGMPSSDPNCH